MDDILDDTPLDADLDSLLDDVQLEEEQQQHSLPAVKASNAFISTRKRVESDAPSFLSGGDADAWREAMRKADPPVSQGNFSRAYRSFLAPGDGGGLFFAGSDGGRGVSDADFPNRLFKQVLSGALEHTEFKDPAGTLAKDPDLASGLSTFYLKLLAKDLKAPIQKQADYDPLRFPNIAEVILGPK